MRMKPAAPLLALLLSAACTPAGGPAVRVEPGSAHLEPARITAGTDSLALSIGDGPTRQVVGRMLLETRTPSAAAPGAITRVERLAGAAGRPEVVDSFLVARSSLAPLSAAPVEERRRQWLEFHPDRVLHLGQDGRAFDVPLPRPAFYGNSMDLLLRALPLRPGFRAVLPLYRPDAREVGDAEVEVEAEEEVGTADGGACWAWRVRVESEGYGGTYWIASGTHALVRYRSAADPVELLRLSGCAFDGRGGGAR
jgi:hypothetical protein